MTKIFWQWLRRHRSSNWFGLMVLIAATTIILAPALFFSTTFFTNLDNVDQFYSWYDKLATSIHSGEFPLWNANTFGGQSFVGEIQQGVFYPLNLLCVWLFGSETGITHRPLEFLMALHFLMASYGMYLVLKKLNLRTIGSLCGGLIYAFSGVVAIRAASQSAIFFGLALLPYPFLYLLKYYEAKKHLKWLVAAGIALGLIILSGHIQPFFHAVMIMIIFELVRFPFKKPILRNLIGPILQTVKRFAVIFVATLAITLPQAWLTYQYIPNAYRVQAEGYQSPDVPLDYGHFAKTFSVEPHEAANFLEPNTYPARDGNNLYIGLLPLVIIILAAIFGLEKIKQSEVWAKHSRFISALAVVSILALVGYWTWFAVVLYEFPFVRQVRQLGRYTIMLHFALMILLAICIDVVARIRFTKKQAYWLLAIAGFIFINSVYLFLLRKHIFGLHFAVQNLILACGIFVVALIRDNRLRIYFLAFLIFLTAVANGLWFFPKAYPGVRVVADYNLKQDLASLLEATDGNYRIEVVGDALPVNIANAYDFQITGGYGATIYSPYFEFNHKTQLSADFKRDLLGVVYLVNKEPAGEIIYADDHAKIFVQKRPTALSKLFTTSKEGSSDRKDYKSLEVKAESYLDHFQSYTVELTEESLVIISEVQYPGWELTVDGKPHEWEPYTIDNIPIFRSFWLPKGTHSVVFEYKPFGF